MNRSQLKREQQIRKKMLIEKRKHLNALRKKRKG